MFEQLDVGEQFIFKKQAKKNHAVVFQKFHEQRAISQFNGEVVSVKPNEPCVLLLSQPTKIRRKR